MIAAQGQQSRSVPVSMGWIARDFKPINKKTIVGSFTLEWPSGLVIKEILSHQRDDSRWVQLPAREWTTTNGEKKYSQLIDFRDDAAKNRFRDEALSALDELQKRPL